MYIRDIIAQLNKEIANAYNFENVLVNGWLKYREQLKRNEGDIDIIQFID